jgi:hypothetical protein
MEILPNPPILPSNAPPLPSLAEVPPDVLREFCGNRGHESGFAEDKKAFLSPLENQDSISASAAFYPHHHVDRPSTYERSKRKNYEEEIACLYRRLQNCEGYMKYRKRQPGDHTDKEKKWADHTEDAFFRGIKVGDR